MPKESKELPKHYDSKESEQRWQVFWEEERIYAFDKDAKDKEIYSIDTPPPTVSGKMHIGHAFSYAQQDFIARFQRMAGKNVFYPFGTDDNGLPTKLLIEKTKGVKAEEMDRKEFVSLCLDVLDKELVNEVATAEMLMNKQIYSDSFLKVYTSGRRA